MKREFTGKHMLFSMIAFFSVIIAVNLVMATFANTSWTGLMVKNVYVESQKFNQKIEATQAQENADRAISVSTEGTILVIAATSKAGDALLVEKAEAMVSRPAHEYEDRLITLFQTTSGELRANEALARGVWNVALTLTLANGETDKRLFRVTVD